MSGFGKTAIDAVELVKNGVSDNPIDAWNKAIVKYYDINSSCLTKSCPKSAFLGLCEDGYIKGIKNGSYTKSKTNKQYAIEAVQLLQADNSLARNQTKLWRRLKNCPDSQDGQMAVVIALWRSGLVNGYTA